MINSSCQILVGKMQTEFPEHLNQFIESIEWTFAKTMPKWPHEYIVRKNTNEKLFIDLVQYIRSNGYEGYFYKRKLIYYEHKGMVYWTMGAPLDETVIINRCKPEDTYEFRLENGTLPE